MADPPKVVGMGSCGLDYLAAVAAFPKPDEKLRTTALEVPAARRPPLTCAPASAAVASVFSPLRAAKAASCKAS